MYTECSCLLTALLSDIYIFLGQRCSFISVQAYISSKWKALKFTSIAYAILQVNKWQKTTQKNRTTATKDTHKNK